MYILPTGCLYIEHTDFKNEVILSQKLIDDKDTKHSQKVMCATPSIYTQLIMCEFSFKNRKGMFADKIIFIIFVSALRNLFREGL